MDLFIKTEIAILNIKLKECQSLLFFLFLMLFLLLEIFSSTISSFNKIVKTDLA